MTAASLSIQTPKTLWHSETDRPEHRPEEIHIIVNSIERYNPQSVTQLEEYVNQQCQTGVADLLANLVLLKLYQFNPDQLSHDHLLAVLSLAMTVVPEPDFDLCLCLLNDALINDESVAKLIQLKQLLDGARFAEFWATLDDAGDDGETRELVADVVNFDDLVRQLVARTIAASHRTIARGLAQKFLNISAEAAFATFAQECGWTVEAQSGLVHIPPNTSNQATVAVVNEQLGLGQMSKLLSASATPIGL